MYACGTDLAGICAIETQGRISDKECTPMALLQRVGIAVILPVLAAAGLVPLKDEMSRNLGAYTYHARYNPNVVYGPRAFLRVM